MCISKHESICVVCGCIIPKGSVIKFTQVDSGFKSSHSGGIYSTATKYKATHKSLSDCNAARISELKTPLDGFCEDKQDKVDLASEEIRFLKISLMRVERGEDYAEEMAGEQWFTGNSKENAIIQIKERIALLRGK